MRDIGTIKSHGQENILAYRFTDILLISLTLLVLKSLYLGTWEIQYILALCIALVAYSIVGELLGVYVYELPMSICGVGDVPYLSVFRILGG